MTFNQSHSLIIPPRADLWPTSSKVLVEQRGNSYRETQLTVYKKTPRYQRKNLHNNYCRNCGHFYILITVLNKICVSFVKQI